MGRVLLVRHGQSTWNAAGRWQGQADPPLSTLGVAQARAAARTLVEVELIRVVASDLDRARTTAELLASDHAVRTDPVWRERHAGEWTGLTRAEIEARHPGSIERRRWPRGFESDEELLARVLPALEALVRELDGGPDDGVVMVVTHGGVIRALEHHLGADAGALPNLAGRWLHALDGGLVAGDRQLLLDPDDVEITVPHQL